MSVNSLAIQAVAEDIYQVRLPLPFRLNHIQSYLLRSSQGWTIIDFGLHWSEAKTVWQTALEELKIQPEDIEKLVLTHMHPDHFGMAGWFQEWSGCPIHVSAISADQIQQVWVNHAWAPEKVMGWWDQSGVPSELSHDAAAKAVHLRQQTLPHPQTFEIIVPGSSIQLGERTFQAIHAPGHAEGQLLFYDAASRLILSGDQVLMKITPNIGIWPTSSDNPLANYLDSLHSLKALDVQTALPGHMAVITNWQERIEEILLHHEDRLTLTLNALANPTTIYDVGQTLFSLDNLSPHEIRFAVAETLAHVRYLVYQGQVTQTDAPVPRYQIA